MSPKRPKRTPDGSEDNYLQKAREGLYTAESRLRRADRSDLRSETALGKLLGVIMQVNLELNVERVLNVAAREVIDVFEAERVFILELLSGECLNFLVAVDFRGQSLPNPNTQVSHAVIRETAGTRQAVLVADATADPRFANVSSVQHLQLHSVMAAPLLARGDLLGVIYVDNRALSGVFNEHSLKLLGILASHIGVAKRNAQLFEQLDAARVELAQSERLKAIGQVATFAVHELKNPLGSIKILLKALQERWEEPELREKVLDLVPKEIDHLDNAVGEILDYARPTRLLRVPVDLAKVTESALRALVGETEAKGVRVTKQFEEGIPRVLADGERLRGVFINLIKNSLEAMADCREKALRVSVRRLGGTQEEVVIEDSGPGIPQDKISDLFEPFHTTKGFGTGIGLAMGQKLIQEHGGMISVENAEHGGARFRVSLPISGT